VELFDSLDKISTDDTVCLNLADLAFIEHYLPSLFSTLYIGDFVFESVAQMMQICSWRLYIITYYIGRLLNYMWNADDSCSLLFGEFLYIVRYYR
jgi:hypothetical protein